MIDAECISETLEALTDDATSRRYAKEHQTLRGIRGVPTGEIARLGDAVWQEDGVELPRDLPALHQLYGAAWEDGLLAIGLLATCVPDDPEAALAVGESSLQRVDDRASADALGWLVLGGAALATHKHLPVTAAGNHLMADRAIASAAMAWVPCPIEGPSAASSAGQTGHTTRTMDGQDAPRMAPSTLREPRSRQPSLHSKGIATRGQSMDPAAPDEVRDWAASVPGGISKVLRGDIEKVAKKAKRNLRP